MGHLFMFLCELIIALEFLLSVKMVEFFSEPTNVKILMILYKKKQIYGINQRKQLSRQLQVWIVCLAHVTKSSFVPL